MTACFVQDAVSGAYQATDVDVFAIASDAKAAAQSIWGFLSHLARMGVGAAKMTLTENALSIQLAVCAVFHVYVHPLLLQAGCPIVQLILRYAPNAQALIDDFDVDASCLVFTGEMVFGNGRGLAALRTRRFETRPEYYSNRYVGRLVKYAARGFAITLPDGLKRPSVECLEGTDTVFHSYLGMVIIDRLSYVKQAPSLTALTICTACSCFITASKFATSHKFLY
jgi:hypothetical protein